MKKNINKLMIKGEFVVELKKRENSQNLRNIKMQFFMTDVKDV